MNPNARGRRGAGMRLVALLTVLAVALLAACGSEEEGVVAREGDTVAVHYTGSLDNGEVFDSSRDGEPLSFTVGTGQVIPGFDEAVKGMEPGETKKVRLEPDQAYGERSDEFILEVPTDSAPEGLSEGDLVQLSNGQPARVTEVTDDKVTVDANHPLAGEALTFEIELLTVQ